MQRLSLASLDIPECYLVNNDADINLCRKRCLPYIIWHRSYEDLQKAAMMSQMQKQFPGINWEKEYGINEDELPQVNIPNGYQQQEEQPQSQQGQGQGQGSGSEQTEQQQSQGQGSSDGSGDGDESSMSNSHVCDSVEGQSGFELGQSTPMGVASTNKRHFKDTEDTSQELVENSMKLNEFIDDPNVSVNTQMLLKLKLLPKFLSNIVQSIQIDKTHSKWQMGYDKKRKLCIGNLKPKKVLRNLIILDVSGSIPRGISDTMITLLNTLKHELHADVIVTSVPTIGWTYEEELPDAEWIRIHFHCGNESSGFYKTLINKFQGAKFNNVYSFGDNDCPDRYDGKYINECKSITGKIPNIKVNNVYHFHTDYNNTETGYAEWIKEVNPNVKQFYDTTWCNNMYMNYEY